MAQAKPIIFIHGLFQGPFKPGVSQFLLPNPVSIPDLPGYGTNRPASPDDISVGAAAAFIYAHIHELGYDQAHLVGHSVGGGGALGAYAYGVIKALYQQPDFSLDVVTGVSIVRSTRRCS